MDISSIIIGIICLAMFVVPPIYWDRVQKQKEKRFIGHFLALAEKQLLKITEREMWNNRYCIGLDQDARRLFYLKRHEEGKEEIAVIDLSTVRNCKVMLDKRKIPTKRGDFEIIEHINLVFQPYDQKQPEQIVEIFDLEESIRITGERPLANKWEKKINSMLQMPIAA